MPDTTAEWATLGLWLLIPLAATAVILETVELITEHQLRGDLEALGDWSEQRIGHLAHRLERIPAPGERPYKPTPSPEPDTTILPITRALPQVPPATPADPDKPAPWQNVATRPDFQPKPTTNTNKPDRRGKHRAH
jgi:hypothetical protein